MLHHWGPSVPAGFVNPFWKTEKEAIELLARSKIAGAKVIRRSSDVILFEQHGKAYTAWLDDDGLTILRLDQGFVADFD